MTPQQLKSSILQLAIQGKLVPQIPGEGTGEELYQQIQKEKQALIKSGKIKKEKPLPPIAENEIPFEIPEGWRWCRLRNIVYNRGQETPSVTFSYIDIGSIDNLHQCLNNDETIIEPNKAPSRARKIVAEGDILYSTVRPYLHNMCIINKSFSFKPIASTGFAVITCYNGVYNKFLFYCLLSPFFDNYANDNENSKGVAYPAINDDRLYRALIPLPPLAEQRRIVAKIEALMPLIDRYDKAWTQIEAIQKKFPCDLKKSILQMAIQGKLVPQIPGEGTGEELYQQIQKEKQALIKSGKIKKEKPLPDIGEDEVPFEIPESWRWCRLGEICKSITDGDHQPPPQTSEGVPFLVISNVSNGQLDFTNTRFVSKEYFNSLSNDRIAESGDILFTVTGSYGIPIVVNTNRIFCFQRHISLLKIIGNLDYIYITLLSPIIKEQCDKLATGTAQKTVGLTALRNMIIPLPPLAEQRRIVAKIEELMPLCDRLIRN